MKKFAIGIISMLSILAGTSTVATAQNDAEAAKVSVRFYENTLVVSSPALTESRLYTYKGRLLETEKGKYARFELEQGAYLLCADVDGQTISRKVVLR